LLPQQAPQLSTSIFSDRAAGGQHFLGAPLDRH
jgi:hypothetical protein